VSKIIKRIHPAAVIAGNPTPPRTGAFEVIIDKKLVYSKFETGEFPKDEEVKNWFN